MPVKFSDGDRHLSTLHWICWYPRMEGPSGTAADFPGGAMACGHRGIFWSSRRCCYSSSRPVRSASSWSRTRGSWTQQKPVDLAAVEKSPDLVPVMEQDRVSLAPSEAASEEPLQRAAIAVGW